MSTLFRMAFKLLFTVALLFVLWLGSATLTATFAQGIGEHSRQLMDRVAAQSGDIDEWITNSHAAVAEVEKSRPLLNLVLWVSAPGFREDFGELVARHRTWLNDYGDFITQVEELHAKNENFAPLFGETLLLDNKHTNGQRLFERIARPSTLNMLQDAGKLMALANTRQELQRRARGLDEAASRLESRMRSEIHSLITVPSH